MSPLFRSPAAVDEALDRALSQTEIPQVPSGLADRIVATVTALPQEEPATAAEISLSHRTRQPRLALAASIAAVVALSAGVIALWQADSRQESRDRGSVAFAQGPAKVAPHVASSANPAQETNLNPATAISATGNRGVRAATTSSEVARFWNEPDRSATPNDTTGATPTPSIEAGDHLAHDTGPSMPAHPSEKREPVGPSLAGREMGPSSTPDGGVYGPPVPQGLGISGGGKAQTPNSPPVANDQGGTGPTGQGSKTSPTGSAPGGRAPGTRR